MLRLGRLSQTASLTAGCPCCFGYDWRRVLPRLAQLTSVIAMDLRGFGSYPPKCGPACALYERRDGFRKLGPLGRGQRVQSSAQIAAVPLAQNSHWDAHLASSHAQQDSSGVLDCRSEQLPHVCDERPFVDQYPLARWSCWKSGGHHGPQIASVLAHLDAQERTAE